MCWRVKTAKLEHIPLRTCQFQLDRFPPSEGMSHVGTLTDAETMLDPMTWLFRHNCFGDAM